MQTQHQFKVRHDGGITNIRIDATDRWQARQSAIRNPQSEILNTQADAIMALQMLRGFIGPAQLHCIGSGCRGEEKQFFFDKLVELAGIVNGMPTTGQTDGQGDNAIAHLHYFAGGQASCWITEKDIGFADDEPSQSAIRNPQSAMGRSAIQSQAFGLADLFGDGGELGYISLPEWLENGAELDLYFKPTTLGEIKAKP